MGPMRAALPALLLVAIALAGCQGPSLADALPQQAATVAGTPTPQPDRPATSSPEGLRAFLTKGSERGPSPVSNMDQAMGEVLDAQARGRVRSPRAVGADGCTQEDELDRFACERGLTREAARQLYKHRKYSKSEKAPTKR